MKKIFPLLLLAYSSLVGAQPAPALRALPRIKDTASMKISPAAKNALANLGSANRIWLGPESRSRHSSTAQWIGVKRNKEVYRVDLSALVSKYIGETEKNLSRIFDAADNKDWILFFDEADALFGKRTEVRDAHDKYANQEVAYFLQRVAKYQGLVLVATSYGERLKGFVKIDP